MNGFLKRMCGKLTRVSLYIVDEIRYENRRFISCPFNGFDQLLNLGIISMSVPIQKIKEYSPRFEIEYIAEQQSLFYIGHGPRASYLFQIIIIDQDYCNLILSCRFVPGAGNESKEY